MTPVLCEVVPYLPLEKDDEHKVREISSINKDSPRFLIEYIMDNLYSSDENND